jgi:hypothetical protein
MFLLAFLSYRFIETPLRRTSWSASRFFSIVYGVSVSATASGFLFILSQPLEGRLYLGRLLNIPVLPNLQRSWYEDRITGEYLEKCHVGGGFSSELINDCLDVAAGKKNGKIYLIGDSHARNYLPALKGEFREQPVAYLAMGHGCAFLPPVMMSTEASSVMCQEYVAETNKYLSLNAHSGDVVFIGQRLFGADERMTGLYVDYIKSFATRLGEKHVPVVMLDGTYPPPLDPELCVELPWRPFGLREECSVTSETVRKAFGRFDQQALDATSQVANLFYAALRMGLCSDGVCGQTTATGLPIWHVSMTIGQSYWPDLRLVRLMRVIGVDPSW